MDKGIIWDITQGFPAHVVSWHEMQIPKLGNIRVWIHSKGEPNANEFTYGKDNRARVKFTFGSIEIQVHGDEFTEISEDEKQLRLKLASFSPVKTKGSVKSSNFRFIPVGQLEIDHMQCIKACYDKHKFDSPAGIRIVKSDKTPTLIFKNGAINTSEKASNFESQIEFRSTKGFAIAVAKLYSDLSQIGSQKIIKQISVDTGLSSENIYTSLRIARGHGWLTSNGVGKAGGTLSPTGIEMFKELGGEKTISNLLNMNGNNK